MTRTRFHGLIEAALPFPYGPGPGGPGGPGGLVSAGFSIFHVVFLGLVQRKRLAATLSMVQ